MKRVLGLLMAGLFVLVASTAGGCYVQKEPFIKIERRDCPPPNEGCADGRCPAQR